MKGNLLLSLSGVIVVSGIVFSNAEVTTNCGGNNAALANVQNIVALARANAFDAPDHSFRFSSVSAETREELAVLSQSNWLRGAHFFVSNLPMSEFDTRQHRLVVVCDKPYRNVPRRWFTGPPTHAVGYSDGSSGLISASEFAALNRAEFVSLDELHPSVSK